MSDDLPHQVEVRPDDGTIEFTLKAMAHNYSGGHSWDHLDGTACATAAATITQLRADLDAANERAEKAAIEAVEANFPGTIYASNRTKTVAAIRAAKGDPA